jgi:hypothetical protein
MRHAVESVQLEGETKRLKDGNTPLHEAAADRFRAGAGLPEADGIDARTFFSTTDSL